MKDIFKYCRTELMGVAGLNWVDMDKGQLSASGNRPPVEFPAALLRVDYPQTQDMSKAKQMCTCRITVRLAFDFYGDTDQLTQEQELDQSLSYFDTVLQAHNALQGKIENGVFNRPLQRISQTEESRNDGIKVLNLVYTTVVYD